MGRESCAERIDKWLLVEGQAVGMNFPVFLLLGDIGVNPFIPLCSLVH